MHPWVTFIPSTRVPSTQNWDPRATFVPHIHQAPRTQTPSSFCTLSTRAQSTQYPEHWEPQYLTTMDDIWWKAAKKLCTHDPSDTRVKQNPKAHTASTKTTAPHQVVSPPSWCNPETVTLEQINENTHHLLREWPKDNGILFPREILKILQDLKSKVRARDEKRAQVPVSPKPVNLPAEGPEIVTTTSEKAER